MANVIQTFPRGTGGGHTILDNSGTAVTDRKEMQFKGLSVTDNPTDEVTEVEAVGLNQDSLNDIANANISNAMVGSGLNYSTSEQIVGRWLDGKPVYQISLTGYLINGNGDSVIVSGFKSSNNVDKIIKIEGTLIDKINGATYMLSCASSYYSEVTMESGNLIVRTKGFSSNYMYNVILYYTKTTDT